MNEFAELDFRQSNSNTDIETMPMSQGAGLTPLRQINTAKGFRAMASSPTSSQRSSWLACAVCGLALVAVGPAWAQAPGDDAGPSSSGGSYGRDWTGAVVVGVISVPEYEGSAGTTPLPLIAGELRWDDYRYAAFDGVSGRVNLLDQEGLEFGPAINVTFGRDKNIESKKVRLLGEIDPAVELGVFVAYQIDSPVRAGDTIRFAGQVVADVTDVHGGVLGDVSATYSAPIGDRWRVSTSAALSFASDDYAETYFSVTQSGAAISGLPRTKVEAGAKDFSLSANFSYGFNERWSLFGLVEYSRLLGDFADSPIVAREGDENQVSAGIGVGWRF
jgi:outer membrane scaffolding protein for murein synthesis (MipA/OmpV family)